MRNIQHSQTTNATNKYTPYFTCVLPFWFYDAFCKVLRQGTCCLSRLSQRIVGLQDLHVKLASCVDRWPLLPFWHSNALALQASITSTCESNGWSLLFASVVWLFRRSKFVSFMSGARDLFTSFLKSRPKKILKSAYQIETMTRILRKKEPLPLIPGKENLINNCSHWNRGRKKNGYYRAIKRRGWSGMIFLV